MTKGQWTNFFREIKGSLNRYLSILFMVALGVAFYAGIRSCEPDMKMTTDTYMDGQHFMDARVISTLGLTDADLEAIREIRGVEEAEGMYSVDLLTNVDDVEEVLTVITVPEDISRLYLTAGRLPLKSGECLVDELFSRSAGVKVGDTIKLHSGNDTPVEESLKQDTYTVVGVGKNPYYLTWERGSSTVGNGTVSGFLALPKSDFLAEAYSQIYARGEGLESLSCYSDEYDEGVALLLESIEAIASERCGIRYDEVVVAGWDAVEDAKAQLEDGRKQLEEAEEELEENREKLEDAQKEYDEGVAEIEAKTQELNDGKLALEKGRLELERQEAKFEEARMQVVVMETMLTTAQAAYEKGLSSYYEMMGKILGHEITNSEDLKAWLEQNQMSPGLGAGGSLEEIIQSVEAELAAMKAEIDGLVAQVASARVQLDAASEQLIAAKVKIQTSQLQIEEGERLISEGKAQLAAAKVELDLGWEQLTAGEEELEKGWKEFEEANEEALIEIADAEERLAGLDYPEWYVLDRGTIQTYVEFGHDAEAIGKLAQVFPFLFFMVAALVSLTTMTRMVEEERLQIGTMKALGYSRWAIISKYVLYALSASLLGSLLGIFAGGKVFPFVVISAYKAMYENLQGLVMPYRLDYSLIAAGFAIGFTVIATMMACWKELLATPASLMRPAAPKQGKRVFLEHIGFIWQRLNFSTKSTIRNLLRYKKRFFMTIFGIGACMGLLMVGFGLRDSLMVIVDNQYKTIWMYDVGASFDTNATTRERAELFAYLNTADYIESYIQTHSTTMEFEAGGVNRSGSLVVPEDVERFKDFTSLRTMEDRVPLDLDGDGAIITEKLSRVLDVERGDTIYLKVSDTEEYPVRIIGVTEQYSQHYVYLSAKTYETVFGKTPEMNFLEINLTEVTDETESTAGTELLALDAVQNITLSTVQHRTMASMIGALDMVIVVLILSAGLLAFVVLYNLNNINITERRRELATLKVLGFYDQEVAMYVYRENVILTLFGIVVGIFLGRWLHLFVVVTVEIDMLLFGRQIELTSFVYGAILTALFSFIVNVAMFYKLQKIDMVESLKSVE